MGRLTPQDAAWHRPHKGIKDAPRLELGITAGLRSLDSFCICAHSCKHYQQALAIMLLRLMCFYPDETHKPSQGT